MTSLVISNRSATLCIQVQPTLLNQQNIVFKRGIIKSGWGEVRAESVWPTHLHCIAEQGGRELFSESAPSRQVASGGFVGDNQGDESSALAGEIIPKIQSERFFKHLDKKLGDF